MTQVCRLLQLAVVTFSCNRYAFFIGIRINKQYMVDPILKLELYKEDTPVVCRLSSVEAVKLYIINAPWQEDEAEDEDEDTAGAGRGYFIHCNWGLDFM